ncbi:MAG: hypothetical protein NT137_06860 [Methanomassiliicoccales archaeon]|nr:hypothetical protein [Methanomassiliicoccales archaeon]
MDAKHCVGEESCSMISHEPGERRHHHDCDREQWFGLYCAKYQRFYCAGKENCTTVEGYMQHLTNYKQSQWRP